MHTFIRRALQTALVTGGLVAAGATMAHADPVDDLTAALDETLGGQSGSLLPEGLVPEGTIATAPVTAPVTIAGTAVAIGGDAESTGSAEPPSGTSSSTKGDLAEAPVTAPITVSGLSLAVLGDAGSAGEAVEPVPAVPVRGSQASAPVTAPVTLAGLSVAVLGDTVATAPTPTEPTPTTPGPDPAGPGPSTTPVRDLVGSVPGGLDLTGPATAAPGRLASTGLDLAGTLLPAALMIAAGISLRRPRHAMPRGHAVPRWHGGLSRLVTQRRPHP